MSRGRLSYPFPLALLYPAVFLTGATALVYEIVWTRRLTLLLGSTSGAVAAVLSSFMVGLALGALLVGRRADTSRRPLRWYGALELGVGFYAFAFDGIVRLVGGVLPHAPWPVSVLLLLLPTALMGGTFPVLARAAADTTQRGVRAMGGLYGVNTLGAVFGAGLATFVLLERFGLSGSTYIAAGVNVAVGALFWLLSILAGDREIFAAESRPGTGSTDLRVLAAFFLAGFAGLALEVAWLRVLVYFLEGFTIAFGLMLATYLLGLGSGALAGTFLASRSTQPYRLLVRLLALEGLLAVATLLFCGGLNESLMAMRRALAEQDRIGFSYAAGLFFAAAKVILPATICGGALLPVVARISLMDRERIARHGGEVYAASTFGAVLAPPVAVFLLIPMLGVTGTVVAAGALLLLAAFAIAAGQGARTLATAGVGAALLAAVALLGGLGTPLLERTHVLGSEARPRRLLQNKDGTLAGVAVVEDLDSGSRALYLDSFRAAETGRHYGYMRMLGHLPLLLHSQPRQVCVIAFGTGTTAGAVSLHPEVEKIVCVEIEPVVYEMADAFAAHNRDVLKAPRTERVVADGREYLARDGPGFDVITLEPLLPNMPGAVYLYTREFYETARGRLNRGGLLCQWIPVHVLANEDFRRLVASMTAAFEHVSLWYFEQSAILIGGEAAPRVTAQSILERCSREEIAGDLRAALVGDAAHLLAAEVAADADLRAALAGAEPMTDDRTVVEFRPLPAGFRARTDRYRKENLLWIANSARPGLSWLRDAGAFPGIEAAQKRNALALRFSATGGLPTPELGEAAREDGGALYVRYVFENASYPLLLEARRPLEAASLTLVPDRSEAFLRLAEDSFGSPEDRRRYLTLAVRENPLLRVRDVTRDAAARLLEELAQGLKEEARRFCLNRARFLRGQPMEPGKE